ncbi:MAG: DUF5666 domain-containing protein [Chloroflexota bacterium]|nr:DUF5666 domain-containing protein [Chloroflexota bacterium]
MGHTITRTIVTAASTTVLVASLTGAAFASSGTTTRANGAGAPTSQTGTPRPGTTRSGTTQSGTGVGRGPRGKGGPGGKHGRGGKGGPGGKGGGLVVTAVNGDTITATGRAITETVQVSSTTVYTEAGSPASLSDVTVGSRIQARGTSSGTNSINATAIIIQLPAVNGVVTAVNGDSLTVTRMGPRGGRGPRGAAATTPGTTGTTTATAPTTTTTVLVTSSTTYALGGRPASTSSTSTATSASLSSITVGTRINAEGTLGSDGVLTARRIQIAPARAAATGTTPTPGTTSGS